MQISSFWLKLGWVWLSVGRERKRLSGSESGIRVQSLIDYNRLLVIIGFTASVCPGLIRWELTDGVSNI